MSIHVFVFLSWNLVIWCVCIHYKKARKFVHYHWSACFLFRQKRVSVICFHASKGFKMENSLTASGKSGWSCSFSLSSSSSSYSLSLSSHSSESNAVIKKMDDSKGDEIEVLEPYPKKHSEPKWRYLQRSGAWYYLCLSWRIVCELSRIEWRTWWVCRVK